MKVTFYRATEKGYEKIGILRLEDGQIVAEPTTSLALSFVLTSPIRVFSEGEMKIINATDSPELFLSQLPRAYGGSYFRAGDVEG